MDEEYTINGAVKDISEFDIQEQVRILSSISKIFREICISPNIEVALRRVIDIVSEFLKVELCSIMLFDEKNKELMLKVAKGLDKELINTVRVKLGQGIAGWVAEKKKPLIIPDITKDKRFAPRAPSRYYTNSLMSLPLIVETELCGVLNVNNKISREVFTKEDLQKGMVLLPYVSGAIKLLKEFMMLKEAARARTELIMNIAHELKPPVVCIEAQIKSILEVLNEGTGAIHLGYLKGIQEDLARLRRMIDNLRQAVEFDTVRFMIPVLRKVDFREVVEEVVTQFEERAYGKKIILAKRVPPNPVLVFVDKDLMQEVLVNLIENGIQSLSPGNVIEVILHQEGKEVKVEVVDNGPGIEKEDLEWLFDRKDRMDKILSGKIKGTGLGLPLVKDIIEMHRGRIWVESKVKKGTKFIFVIPIYEPEERAFEEFKGKKVVIVEDDPIEREKLKFVMEDYGFKVIIAVDGQEGLMKVKEERPSLVILDLLLPKMDGYEITRLLKYDNRYKDIPIIVFSGRIGEDSKRVALECGADSFLEKPLSVKMFMETVEELLKTKSE